MKVLINEASQPIVELALGEEVLITFGENDRNVLVKAVEGGADVTWSRSRISPEMAAKGWKVVPGSERDYADLVARSNDPNLPSI